MPENVQGLAQGGWRCVNRQAGSGTRLLMDHLLQQAGDQRLVLQLGGVQVHRHHAIGLAAAPPGPLGRRAFRASAVCACRPGGTGWCARSTHRRRLGQPMATTMALMPMSHRTANAPESGRAMAMMPNTIPANPVRPRSHSFEISLRNRTAAMISRIPLRIAQIAMM